MYRSRFLPRFLGVWLIINGFAYVILSFTGLLFPLYYNGAFNSAFPFLFGEVAFMLWLVIAVCSTRNVETARSIGADHVIGYRLEDFTKSGQRYDLIMAANAYHSIFDYRRALSQDGIYVIAGGNLARIFQTMLLAPLLSRIGSKKICFFVANINKKDLVLLRDLLEAGKVVSVIDRRYPLSQVAEALRYLEDGHARGKVIIINS